MDIKIAMQDNDILPITVREEEDKTITLFVAHFGPRGEHRIEITLDQDPQTLLLVAASMSRTATRLLEIQANRNEMKED